MHTYHRPEPFDGPAAPGAASDPRSPSTTIMHTFAPNVALERRASYGTRRRVTRLDAFG